MKRRCTVVELSKPYRNLTIPEKSQRVFENGILGSSLVHGLFVENAITISCPGVCISTLCSDRVIENMEFFGVRSVVVMAGTNNLFDKPNKPLMAPIETSDEMYYPTEKLKFYKFKITIMALNNRKNKWKIIKKVNDCYRDVARDHWIPFIEHKKFRYRHISSDGVHPNPQDIRELAPDFWYAFKQIRHCGIFKARMVLSDFNSVIVKIARLEQKFDFLLSARLEQKA